MTTYDEITVIYDQENINYNGGTFSVEEFLQKPISYIKKLNPFSSTKKDIISSNLKKENNFNKIKKDTNVSNIKKETIISNHK